MIKTYALQTLIALASAATTVGLLAAAAEERTTAPSTTCPVVESVLAGALPFAAPAQPAPDASAPQVDA
jgi:hypothetical protein